MLIFPDTTVLVNFAYIQRMDLLEALCNGKRSLWVERVRGETAPWRDKEGTASIAKSDFIFGDPILLSPAQRQQARILRTQMAKPGDSPERHYGEAQTIVVAAEYALNEKVYFVTDDMKAAERGLEDKLQPLGTGDILSLLCKTPPDAAERYFRTLRGGDHFPAWHQLDRPSWA